MLTKNQTTVMRYIDAAPEPVKTVKLGRLHKEEGPEFGTNAAQKLLKRLADRDLVVSSGAGAWSITALGKQELAGEGSETPEVDPLEETGDPAPLVPREPGDESPIEAAPLPPTVREVEPLEADAPPADSHGQMHDAAKIRTYLIFEKRTLAGVLAEEGLDIDQAASGHTNWTVEQQERELYSYLFTVEARNAEHALRLGARRVNDAQPKLVEFTLVPVALKMWQPTEVKLKVRQTVSVG